MLNYVEHKLQKLKGIKRVHFYKIYNKKNLDMHNNKVVNERLILLIMKSTTKILKSILLSNSLTNLNRKILQCKIKSYIIALKTSKDDNLLKSFKPMWLLAYLYLQKYSY